MTEILSEVQKERVRQNEKWGEQNHMPIEWIAILTEEVGEASKQAVDHHFENPVENAFGVYQKVQNYQQEERLRNYREELIQVAAVAVQMVECLDRNRKNG